MACIHNQAKINGLINQIREKQAQITSLNNNISKCEDIRKKHRDFNEKINCVINNLEGNTVVAGVPYDNGKMSECLNDSNKTIIDCGNIISQSNQKINLLEGEILSLESSIASLQGNCSACSVIDEKNR